MKRSLLAVLAVTGGFALACGFLDSEAATVTYEWDVPMTFTVDADQLCPADADCQGDTVPAQQDQTLAKLEFGVPVDILEATDNQDLQGLAQRLRSIEITSIDYASKDNSLTFDLPDMEIYVAPLGTSDPEDGTAVHLTTIPTIAAATNTSGRATVEEANRGAASEIFKTLQYTAIPSAQPVVKEGQPFPPSGTSEIELTVNLRIVANPLDSL